MAVRLSTGRSQTEVASRMWGSVGVDGWRVDRRPWSISFERAIENSHERRLPFSPVKGRGLGEDAIPTPCAGSVPMPPARASTYRRNAGVGGGKRRSDRKRGGEGQSGAGTVGTGGRRFVEKKKKQE